MDKQGIPPQGPPPPYASQPGAPPQPGFNVSMGHPGIPGQQTRKYIQ